MAGNGSHRDPAALLARTGLVRDEEVARAAVDAAARAATPFAKEGIRAALGWAAERWPEFTRDTVLPTLQDAVGADDDRPRVDAPRQAAPAPQARRAAGYAAAAVAILAAAGAWYRR